MAIKLKKSPRLPQGAAKEPRFKQAVTFEAELGRRISKAAFVKNESIPKWLADAAEMRLASGK